MIDVDDVTVMGKDVIMCWRFEDAPLLFQRLSTHGGDEDFVFLVPAEIDEELDKDTAIFDIIYSGYIRPVRKNLGTHIVYITAH